MIKLKNNLNRLFLFLIFLISSTLHNSISFADQKSKLDKFQSSCEIQENKIICFNIKINDTFKVNLLDNPYRIILDFEKKVILSNKKIKKNSLIKNVKFNKENIFGSRLVLELKKPSIITDIIYDKINNNDLFNLTIQISKSNVTNFAIAKHVLKINSGDILQLEEQIIL